MYILIGKIVGTHGIKGELRIISDFEKKDLIFKPSFKLYFGNDYEPHQIKTYRRHKHFDMVLIDELNDINDVLKYKGLNVYILETDLNLANDEYIINELIGYEAYYLDDYCGKIIDFVYNNINNLLILEKEKAFYIPYQEYFIEKIDKENKKIFLKNIGGLIE